MNRICSNFYFLATAALCLLAPFPSTANVLGTPVSGSIVSGVGVISGFHCASRNIEIFLDNQPIGHAGSGTTLLGTLGPCGRTDTGFSLLFNFNNLDEGQHTITATADGIAFATSTVTTLRSGGAQWLTGIERTVTIPDFPRTGVSATLAWQQSYQNFVITGLSGQAVAPQPGFSSIHPLPNHGALGTPNDGSVISGVGVISGYHCTSDNIEVHIDGASIGRAGSRTRMAGTADVCGRTDTGYSLLYNFNNLSEGIHHVSVYADGQLLDTHEIRTVKSGGTEWLTGVSKSIEVADFPVPGTRVSLEWVQSMQGFVIRSMDGRVLRLIAGPVGNPGHRDGKLMDATFNSPTAIAADSIGNLYVADGCTKPTVWTAHALIRRISPSGWVASIAGSRSHETRRCITSMTAHPNGSFYYYDALAYKVFQMTPDGRESVFSGDGTSGYLDGSAEIAQFRGHGLTADDTGAMYLSQPESHTIRRIDVNGNVTTFVGSVGTAGRIDGTLAVARFNMPSAIKYDSHSQRLLVLDNGGLRAVTAQGVSTLIPIERLAIDLCINYHEFPPSALAVAADGRIAVAANWGCGGVVGIYRNGQLSQRIGDVWGDAVGDPWQSVFDQIGDLHFADNGDLIIVDAGNSNLKRFGANSHEVALYGGARFPSKSVDGRGSAARMQTQCPALDESGNIWFTQAGELRRLEPSGFVTTFHQPDSENGAGSCILGFRKDGTFIDTSIYGFRHRQLTGNVIAKIASPFGDEYLYPWPAATLGDDLFASAPNGRILKVAGNVVSHFAQTKSQFVLQGLAGTPAGELVATTVEDDVIVVSSTGAGRSLYPPTWRVEIEGPIAQTHIGRGLVAVDKYGAIYHASDRLSVIRRIADGRVDVIYGTPYVEQTEPGPGAGSLGRVRRLLYDKTTHSLIIDVGYAILRGSLPH